MSRGFTVKKKLKVNIRKTAIIGLATVVTIIAVVAIAGIIYAMRQPIKDFIQGTFMNTANQEINSTNDALN